MVTVWAVFQFVFVNVSDVAETVPSCVLELLIPILTFAAGVLVKTTENEAFPPPSVVVRPDVGLTVIPAASTRRSSKCSNRGPPSREGLRAEGRFVLRCWRE